MRTLIASTAAAVLVTTGGALAVAAPAGARTVPSCMGTSLRITHTHTLGATGHGNLVLRFRNISRATCSLRGYPGFDALRANGTVLAHARRTLNGFTGGAHAVRTIVLRPNRVASADVEWMNFNPRTSGSCRFSHSIATTPANTFRTVHFRVSVSKCSLQVHPTVAGGTGNG